MLSKRKIMDNPMPMVSSSMGVVNSLLDKLTKLEGDYSEFKDLTHGLESIRKDLLKFSARGVKSTQVKQWMKQVREVFYDMEDWIDLVIHLAGEFEQDKPERATDFAWSELTEKIEEFKAQIHGAQDRCTRYGLLNKALASDADLADLGPSKVTIDPNLLWGEKTGFVALEGPENELVNHLIDEEKKLKVVSVLGMGGLGKTTLAKEVYGKLKWRFECRAFVYVGPNPSIKTTLINILYQVMSLPRSEVESRDERLVISKLWEFLGKNRYFIVIDDIWSIWAWSAISCTLPDNNLGSRILTTTRIDAVAKSCCVHPTDFVHPMKALSECDSKSLLLGRISVPEEDWPFDSKICDNMLKLCGGKPLAIIVTAGLLDAKCAELGQQKMLEKPIFAALDQYSTSEGIKKILDISFADLSLPVKSCLLYLSAFPEDYIIKKDHLIRIWVAEKFIPKRGEESLWETGESYFNELIGRRLIQPVFLDDGYEYDQAVGCTVHAVILDFILSLSSKENFVTPVAEFRSMSFPRAVIRRLSLNNTNHEDDTLTSSTVDLRKVRLLSCFGDAKGMPDILEFTFLRVLDLNNTMNLKSHHLESIGRLFLLRYLGLRGCGVTVLPEGIGQLQHMEILDLRYNRLGELPASIVGLRKLVCLLLDYCKRLPRGVENMPDLEELTIDVGYPVLLHDVAEIVKSKRLRMLGVRWDSYNSYDPPSLKSFLYEVGKSSLQSLSLLLERYPEGHLLDILMDSWVPPHHLRRFELIIPGTLFRGVPPKMASLVNLTHLRIRSIDRVGTEGLRVLGALPNLILLDLHSEYYGLQRPIISRDGFRCLVVFSYTCGLRAGTGLQFTPGAMQQLRRLRFEFNARETGSRYGEFDFGIQHLSCLTRVHATIRCRRARDLEWVDAAEAIIREQVSKNPNSPVLELSRQIDDRMMARQEEHENVQESYKAQEKNLEQESVISDKDSDEEHATPQKQHDIMELDVDSNTNKQADSRAISMLSEPPPHLVNPGGEVIQILNLVGSALGKICGIIPEDRRLKGELKKGLESIMQEVRMIIADIKDKENNQGATQQTRFLQLQELAYDIEDFIDGLWEPGPSGPILTAIGLDPRPQDLDRIDHLKSRIESLRKWQPSAEASQSGGSTATSGPSAGSPAYTPEDELEGIVERKRELLELLSVADGGQTQQLRVISVVGCRGLGKTALARAVYDDPVVADAFPCRAWVVASECNGAEGLVNKILQQIRPAAAGETTSHVKQPITELHDILKDNRYLVVVDDVKRAEVWKGIEHELPKNGNSSRIIVTTSLRSVANACSFRSYVYTMQYLGQDKSERLLWRKVYGYETKPAPSLANSSKSILDKCDGLPLALISVANYLRGKRPQLMRNYCEKGDQEDYLAAGKESAFGEMKRALMECFDSLPDHRHRSCLLYVSFFPRGHRINRKNLIRRWIAEGLTEEKFARECFDELIDRSIIEPVLVYNGSNKVVERFQVHSVMLEFIIHKSVSNNFISLIRKDEPKLNNDCRVRRLSIQNSSNEGGGCVTKEIDLSSIRSLTICSSDIFDFKECKLLRVLDLEGCKGITERVLDVICKLLFLKYLSLRGSDVPEIPKTMGKLYNLETLDIRETRVEILPVEIIMLPRLAHLFGRFELSHVSGETREKLENGSLQTLAGVVIDKEYRGFEQIMLHARKLSKFKIWHNTTPRGNNSTVSSLLWSLQKRVIGSNALDTLSIDSSDLSKEFLRSLEATCGIRTIKLRGKLESLPQSTTLSELRNLNKLRLLSTGLSSEALSVLQRLPFLEYLKLAEDRLEFGEGSFVVHRDGFPSLQRLCFEAPKLPLLQIEQGAMTKLTSLQMLCQEFADGLGVTGIEHLQRLDEVILYSSASDAVMEAWKRAAIQHQNRPSVKKQQINDAA